MKRNKMMNARNLIKGDEESEEIVDKTEKMVFMDLDLVNLGLWLDINDEFFDKKYPMRYVRWAWLTFVTVSSQLIMVMYLIYEMLVIQLELSEAKKFIIAKDDVKLGNVRVYIRELAGEYIKIDESWIKWMYSILSVHVMVVIFSYVVRSIQ